MEVSVRVCGLCRGYETIDAALNAGASHVEFVFSRQPTALGVGLAKAAVWVGRIPKHVRKVGVFFDQDSIFIDRCIAYAGLHVLRLHATDPRQADAERKRTGRAVWGVVPVRAAKDLAAASRWQGFADRVVYDVAAPEAFETPGSNPSPFDWRIFKEFRHPVPWSLSGPFSHSNISKIIEATETKMVAITACGECATRATRRQDMAALTEAARAAGRQS